MEELRDQPPDLRSLLRSLWRRKWLFLAILISIPAAVYAISSLVTKSYEASALVRLEAVRTDITALTTPTATDVEGEAVLLNTRRVAESASKALDGRVTADSIGGAVRTAPLSTGSGQATDLLYVTAQAEDANTASEIANAYSNAIDDVRTGKALREIDESIESLELQSQEASNPTARAEFERQLQLLRGARSSAEDSTEVIQAAAPPGSPISPHPRRNTALAALVALLLALAAVTLAERLDRRLRDSSELESLLDAPLLSVIPRAAFPGQRPAHGPVKEAFRTLAASLVYFNVEQPISTVMVASPTKGDGKTTVAVHLAVALARDGQRVVLVDGDLRHPQVSVRLGVEPAVGVVDVITRQADLLDALGEVDVGEGRLHVLAAGKPPPNPARLLGSQPMGTLLDELSAFADVVVVDTPPILNVSDAVPLLERVSGIVVVAQVGTTTRDAILRVRQVIETARGNILGGVATGSASAGLYGYGAEYYGDETAAAIEPPLPEPDGEGLEPDDEQLNIGSPPSSDVAPQTAMHAADVPFEGEQEWLAPGPEPDTDERHMEPVEPWPPEDDEITDGQTRPGDPRHVGSVVNKPARIIDQPTQEWDAPAEWDEQEGWGEPKSKPGKSDDWETTDE
jgi:capsular exopolysaccharide synthesis family protein